MRIGDILEWLGAACFVAGVLLGTGLVWATLLTAGVCLVYFAQCYAEHPLKQKRDVEGDSP